MLAASILTEISAKARRVQLDLEKNGNRALIAEAMNIGRERRAFIAPDKIAAICQYSNAGNPIPSEHVPDSIYEFAENVLCTYQPTPCFVVDVVELVDTGNAR